VEQKTTFTKQVNIKVKTVETKKREIADLKHAGEAIIPRANLVMLEKVQRARAWTRLMLASPYSF